MQIQQTHTVKFIKKVQLTEKTATYYFEKPVDFTFLAGQYNRWTLPYHITDGQGSSRFFTISSSPLDKKYLTFTTKNGLSGFKKTLLRVKPDDTIKIFGPMGNLFFNDDDQKPKVYLSGGMGITPFYSMLTYAHGIRSKQSILLIASFSNLQEILFYNELTNITQKNKNISVVYTVSDRNEKTNTLNLVKGDITGKLLDTFIPRKNNSLFYIVGSSQTETSLKELLTEWGITQENIITEQFTGY